MPAVYHAPSDSGLGTVPTALGAGESAGRPGERADRILFESHHLRIRYVPTQDFKTVVVTFMHWHPNPSKHLPGFAETLLSAQGVAAVHITCTDNVWYQYPEMRYLGALLEPVLGLYERRVSYGSSMGAYGALMFSGLIRSDIVIALSPQYSIDPAKAAFDKTWLHIRRTLAFCCDDLTEFPSPAKTYVLYDPAHIDGTHAAAIAREREVKLLPVPGANHPATEFLHQIGMLKQVVTGLISGSFDEAAFFRDLRRASRRSSRYYCWVAGRARNPLRKLRVLEAAERKLGWDFYLCLHKARSLQVLGRIEDAVAEYRRALDYNPTHNWTKIWLAQLYDQIGLRQEAIALAAEAAAAMPEHEQIQAACAKLLDPAAPIAASSG